LTGKNEFKTITQIVKELAQILDCSESALWNNTNSLKKCGLIHNELGKPVKLTRVGVLIVNKIFGGGLGV
jgi:predicted transcriptional regulator